MNNKKTIMIVIIIILLVLITLLVLKKVNDNAEIDTTDNAVLIESSYVNYAWGYQYYGVVICNNGQIYEFEVDDKKADINRDNLVESKYAKKKLKNVSKSDLSLMKEYISQIEDNYTEQQSAMDAGSNSISVYKGDENKKIILKETGDYNRKNTSTQTDALLKLIEKYI